MYLKFKGKDGAHFIPFSRFTSAVFQITDGGVMVLVPHYSKVFVKATTKSPIEIVLALVDLAMRPISGITDVEDTINGN